MLKEAAKADVTLTSNINSRVPETVTKIIEQTVREEVKNMLNTCKGDLCNFYNLALDIEISLDKKIQNPMIVICGTIIGEYTMYFEPRYGFKLGPMWFIIRFYKPFNNN
jgi:hypothetical protein